MAAGLALFGGVIFRLIPTETALGPVARVFDSLAPWFLGAALALALVALLAGSCRAGGLMTLAVLAAMAQLYAEQRSMSQPLAPELAADVRVLFFNVFSHNPSPPGRIAEAVLAADADIVVLAEATGDLPALERLRESYSFVSPCKPGACDLVVASRLKPKRFWRLTLNPVWRGRYAVAEFVLPDGRNFFLATNQLAKPWLSGISEAELAKLAAQWNWFGEGRVVAIGDFNAAPWSRPVRRLEAETGMRGLRWPPATWPTWAGAFGVPIDQILLRGGVEAVHMESFGGDLGSNHRGVIADLAIR